MSNDKQKKQWIKAIHSCYPFLINLGYKIGAWTVIWHIDIDETSGLLLSLKFIFSSRAVKILLFISLCKDIDVVVVTVLYNFSYDI